MEEKKLEAKLREELEEQGYTLQKSRVRDGDVNQYANDHRGYMIVETNTNNIAAGEHYDLTLEDVQKFADEEG